MALRRYICLLLIILFSAGGLYTSVHLAQLHYKKPKYMLNLLDRIPPLEKIYDRKEIEEKAAAEEKESAGPSARDLLEDPAFDPYAAAMARANDAFGNVATEEDLAGGFKKEETCDLSEGFSCTKVDESEFSEIGGIAVSLFGAAGYSLLILLAAAGFFTQKKRFSAGCVRRPDFVILMMYLGCCAGFGFSLWLTWLEAYEIKSFCPYCLASAGFMALAFVAALAGFGIRPVADFFSGGKRE